MSALRDSFRNINKTITSGASDFGNSISNKSMSLKNIIDTPVNSIMKSKESISDKASNFMSSARESVGSLEPVEESSFNFKSILFWILIILLLAFLGFNIFTYLSEGTDLLTNILAPITNTLAMLTGDTTKTTVSNASDGSQEIIDKSADVGKTIVDQSAKGVTGGISVLQDSLRKDKSNTKSIVNPENENSLTDTTENNNDNALEVEPEAVKSDSSQQGYCYIGKINDTRYCAKVSNRNKCMSGDIYPTMDICINPNLRN